MFKSSWLKVCAGFAAVFMGAAALPATAAELTAEEAVLQRKFVDRMVKGLIKGYETSSGKTVSPVQREELRRLVGKTFPRYIAAVRRAGFYEEYKTQMSDPEIDRLNEAILNAGNMDELRQLSRQLMSYIRKQYPRLTEWQDSDRELAEIYLPMFEEIKGVLGLRRNN